MASLNQIALWGYQRPYYYKNSQAEIVQNQTIKDALPIRSWFSDIFVQLNTKRFFNLDWPSLSEEDWFFYIDIIKQIHKNSLRLGVDKFYVVIYPSQNGTSTDLIQHLELAGINYISYADWNIQQLSEKPVIIENDGHSNAEFNRIFSNSLLEQKYLFY